MAAAAATILPPSGSGAADQTQVQRRLAAVAADLEHVVLIGTDPALAHILGPLHQLGHELLQLGRRRHHHRPGRPALQRRDAGEGQLGGATNVGHGPEHR